MKDHLIDILIDWVIDPVMDMLMRRRISGKWHISYLLPLVLLAFGGICYLGVRWQSTLLGAIGLIGALTSAVANLLLFIPREIGEWKDFRSWIADKKIEAELASKEDGHEEKPNK